MQNHKVFGSLGWLVTGKNLKFKVLANISKGQNGLGTTWAETKVWATICRIERPKE